MKKTLGIMVVIIAVALLIGTFTAVPTLAGEKARDGRFIAYDNGTVLDTKKNLMWAAKDNGSNINWEKAKSYCENYRGGGYIDWRLPTIDELTGLYDSSKSYKATQRTYVKLTELIQLSECCHWTSETRASEAAIFLFINGDQYWYHQSNDGTIRALPVRSGKVGSSGSSNAAGPFSFRGILFGKTIKEQKIPQKYFEGGSVFMGYVTYNIYKLPDIGIHFYLSYVSLVDKKIEHYSGEFGSENADKFLDMLTEKYGKPKMETAERQNMMGAKFSSFRASWKVDGYNITLRSPSLEVGRGSIWIMSDKYIQYNDNKKREEKAKAGKNL